MPGGGHGSSSSCKGTDDCANLLSFFLRATSCTVQYQDPPPTELNMRRWAMDVGKNIKDNSEIKVIMNITLDSCARLPFCREPGREGTDHIPEAVECLSSVEGGFGLKK